MAGPLPLALRLAATAALAAAALWGTLFLLYTVPDGQLVSVVAAGLCAAAAVAAGYGLWSGRLLWPALYGIGIAALVAWFVSIAPQGEAGTWAVDVSRPVTAEIGPDRVTVHEVRSFAWRTPEQATAAWETRSYSLAEIATVDLLNSHWMGPAIAHTLVSFGFTDGRFLAVSIEVRRPPDTEFSNVAGFFKRYELAVVAADERDIIRLRTNVRRESVQLFRLALTPDEARAALLATLARANAIAATPRFYNTLAANCTTELFGIARSVAPDLPFDWRIIASGYLPDYADDRQLLDRRHALPDLRRLGLIDARALSADADPDFSARIRDGVPRPESRQSP